MKRRGPGQKMQNSVHVSKLDVREIVDIAGVYAAISPSRTMVQERPKPPGDAIPTVNVSGIVKVA